MCFLLGNTLYNSLNFASWPAKPKYLPLGLYRESFSSPFPHHPFPRYCINF